MTVSIVLDMPLLGTTKYKIKTAFKNISRGVFFTDPPWIRKGM